MSKKLFQIIGRLGNQLGKSFIKSNVPQTGLSSAFKDISKFNPLNNRFAFLKTYLDPHHQDNYKYMHKMQSDKEHEKQQGHQIQEQTHVEKDKSGNIPEKQQVEEKQEKKEKSSFFEEQMESLKKSVDWKKQLSELEKKLEEEKKKISQKAQSAISQQAQKFKQQASAQINELEGKKSHFFNRMRNSVKQKRSKSADYIRQKVQKLQEENKQYVNQKMGLMEQMLDLYKKKLSEFAGSSKDKIAEGSDKIRSSVKQTIEQTSKSRIQFFSKMITKIFWRLLLIIAVASFAYGLGGSVPRQLRDIYLNESKKKEKGQIKKVNDPRQAQQE